MNRSLHMDTHNRRAFLKAAAGIGSVALMPTCVIASSPNDIPGLGLIGAGRMGHNHMRFAKGMCNLLAVCDVDTNHREKARVKLGDGKAQAFGDYRKVLEMPAVDVVYIATPDHWHTKILIEAMKCGKDVYCEKPLTLTIDEGKQIRRVQKETGAVVQVGTMQRSFLNLFVKAVAMCGDGRLGRIKRVTATVGAGSSSGEIPEMEPPKWLDWNQWLGPAQESPFRWVEQAIEPDQWGIGATNSHQQFRHWYDYSGGKMTDWGAHHVDIACWALRAAGQSDSVVSIGGDAKFPVPYKDGFPTKTDRYHAVTSFSITARMTDGAELVINSDGRNGVLIEGEEGRIFVSRGDLAGKPVEELQSNPLPDDAIARTYGGMPMKFNQHKNHWANFFHCVRERIQPISDVTSHLRAIDICHLANIAARFGREMKWDAEDKRILGDEQANGLLAREYRHGFEIEA